MVLVIKNYLSEIRFLNRNIKLYLVSLLLLNLGFGMFSADFNLYILSLGMTPDFLGVILSLSPFTEALSSIPIGYVTEKIGFKRSLLIVNIVLGIAYFIQIITPYKILIMLGAVLIGLVIGGNFIIQLPFLSHYTKDDRNQAFTMTMLVYYSAFALGGLIGGYLPSWLDGVVQSTTIAYRIVLTISCLLILLGSLPTYFLDEDRPDQDRDISLEPYLKGIDANTVKFAFIEFFIGASLAFIAYFLNIIFIYYFNSTLELYGIMLTVLVIPTIFFLFLGPAIAEKFGNLRTVLISRVLTAFLAFFVVMTPNKYIGSGSYILYRSLLGFAQSLWFSFAISVATRRSRMATSVWLEITFQLGMGIAALVGGQLVANESYQILGIISALAMAACFVLTYAFFGKGYLTPLKKELAEKSS